MSRCHFAILLLKANNIYSVLDLRQKSSVESADAMFFGEILLCDWPDIGYTTARENRIHPIATEYCPVGYSTFVACGAYSRTRYFSRNYFEPGPVL